MRGRLLLLIVFSLFSIPSIWAQAQLSFPVQWSVSLDANSIEKRVEDFSNRKFGDSNSGLCFGVSVSKKHPLFSTFWASAELGLNYNTAYVVGESFFLPSSAISIRTNLRRNTSIRTINSNASFLVGTFLGQKQRTQMAFGGFLAYRTLDFSVTDEYVSSSFVPLPVIVIGENNPPLPPGPFPTVIPAPVPIFSSFFPDPLHSRNTKPVFPDHRLQAGISVKASYTLLFPGHQPIAVGLQLNRFLSSNQIWYGHYLKWRAQFALSFCL